MTAERQQPWSDERPERGAVVAIAEIAGRPTTLLPDVDAEPSPLQWLTEHPLTEADALVLCDHDAPQADALLRLALEGTAGYVAMLGSRRRAEHVFSSLEGTTPPEALARLRVPAGLDTGGKAPGEIALSVVAEIVAVSFGRDGGPMKAR
jgi:xanthine/CO dehydrogenase XdhC/CoxF family maturation factor